MFTRNSKKIRVEGLKLRILSFLENLEGIAGLALHPTSMGFGGWVRLCAGWEEEGRGLGSSSGELELKVLDERKV